MSLEVKDEIERKFLVLEDKIDIKSITDITHIEQIYISTKPEIRIRKENNADYYMFIKGEGKLTRKEIPFVIDKKRYEALSDFILGKIITKDRYKLYLKEGYVAEIDVYKEQYEGIVTVEVEFNTEEEANNFVPPQWFGKEVIGNKHYRNCNMAVLRYR
jgi:CYTH domain-containing protein